MTWDSAYRTDKYIWGEKPSELAVFACNYLLKYDTGEKEPSILDVGCGYGRDSVFLARNIRCKVLGIDNAREAIEMARKTSIDDLNSRVGFRCCDFTQMTGVEFDIVFVSNLYQILENKDRHSLRDMVRISLKRGGKLFLSTLSTSDPEHFGKGTRVQSEDNSYIDGKFLHFCTRKEIERDFDFLSITELHEHEYDEPRSNMETHHHISWMLLGIKQ